MKWLSCTLLNGPVKLLGGVFVLVLELLVGNSQEAGLVVIAAGPSFGASWAAVPGLLPRLWRC